MNKNKIFIYQLLPRLFGNINTKNTYNGTIEENGCGKFNQITNKALASIKEMGYTYIWFTGILAHASKTDYSLYGIPTQHPNIVKGNAGSPYAIRDYYDVDADLAVNIDKRNEEFESLVDRSHKNDLKVIIDFVPNHLAREYKSIMKPHKASEFGANDDTNQSFAPNNNFYYIPDRDLDISRLNIEGDINYTEHPAKATGNDYFSYQPTQNDWYETVKLNYGIDYTNNHETHFHPIPDTWYKMKDILLFWASKEVDGFRCDMAEMVPLEFWKWVIPIVKEKYPTVIFIGEIYNKDAYRGFLSLDAFDYLYDKVGLYDTLRDVMSGHRPASDITFTLNEVGDIQHKMLNFVENHDEQRIASSFFSDDALKGVPAMILSACLNVNPVMVYFGQELGEKGMDREGFSGYDGRTTIFDYWSLDKVVRWNNGGEWNTEKLTHKEVELREIYSKVFKICNQEKAFSQGLFYDLMSANYENSDFDSTKHYVFLRGNKENLFCVIINFDSDNKHVEVNIPNIAFDFFEIEKDKIVEPTSILNKQNRITVNSNKNLYSFEMKAYSGEIIQLS